MLQPFGVLHAPYPVAEAAEQRFIVMAVEQIAELGVGRDPSDAKRRVEVVGAQLVLEAALELQHGRVLKVKCCVAGYVAFDRYLLVE